MELPLLILLLSHHFQISHTWPFNSALYLGLNLLRLLFLSLDFSNFSFIVFPWATPFTTLAWSTPYTFTTILMVNLHPRPLWDHISNPPPPFFFFLFWPPHGTWSSQARDQIWAAVATYTAAAAMPYPLTHCAGLGIEPVSWCCRNPLVVGTPTISYYSFQPRWSQNTSNKITELIVSSTKSFFFSSI